MSGLAAYVKFGGLESGFHQKNARVYEFAVIGGTVAMDADPHWPVEGV